MTEITYVKRNSFLKITFGLLLHGIQITSLSIIVLLHAMG